HQSRDDYWKHGSVCEDYTAIKAKVLAVGGWGDAYKNAVPQIVRHIPGAKGIVGPWVHKYPHFAVPEPRIGFLQEALRWWDRWLKDVPNQAENDPDMRTYLMDGVRPQRWYTERPGRWLADPQAHTTSFFISPDGLGAPAPVNIPIRSPHDTGADAGEYCAIWLGPELPGDQRADDSRSVCFDSAPLEDDFNIINAPAIELELTSDKPIAQIAVRLNHLHSDGASTRITYGVLNLYKALGRSMMRDQKEIIRFELDHIAYRVPAGDRIRLAISSSYWPLVWPTPETATLTLTGGSVHIDHTMDTNGWTFPQPDMADAQRRESLRTENHIRRQETDHVSGAVHLIIEDDFGKVRDLDHGLINGSIAREHWTIHPDDPLFASGHIHWTNEIERDEIHLRAEATCAMWSDSRDFHLSATLTAFENDVEIFSKEITDTIPRDHM
ncbi:MAG: CocE/NonD family hydrolase, partial [Pseudomonadota bacterium]